jgi:phospholipase C
MQTRREFMKNAALLSGGAGLFGAFPASIRRALAIEPEAGSSVFDAEHIVILMQENRSFDHCYGTLQGVRGFNDPRAITLPDRNPVWVQANAAGEKFAPFRLNIKKSRITWMGSLPHNWTDQGEARNHGRYDRWLPAKRSGHKEYATMPLTLGYYTREDVPFYYAMADAFTICDQNFCSSLTATTPNRCYLWAGTVREKQSADSPAYIRNEDCEYGAWRNGPTFPERLEDHGVSWKIYQNELTVPTGFVGEEEPWLSNYGDSPIEWFTQYHVRFAENHRRYREKRIAAIPGEIETLRKQLAAANLIEQGKLNKQIGKLTTSLREYEKDQIEFSAQNFEKLSPREKSLHARAFCTNIGDPFYRQLAEISYRDGDVERRVKVPKGDVFHQFRKDVNSGQLPKVSWLVAPENFSDHPSSAWYGAWYISEVLDILTKNPEVWKKTVFILNYDENDGYFDHVPPFVVPQPGHPETGQVSKSIDASLEYVELKQDMERTSAGQARGGPIGLGYRVPMVIASPWSRGGCVCSQVFDHTSVLQFVEELLSHQTGKKIEEPNISRWRRVVCGDLMSAFGRADDRGSSLSYLSRDAFVEEIHKAQFKGLPSGYKALSKEELEQIRRDPLASTLLPRQEAGVRRSCALPYQLEVDGALNNERNRFVIHLAAKKELFGERSAGSPFVVYALTGNGGMKVRDYAVEAGDRLEDSWAIDEFTDGLYHFRVYGPNGFFREFIGGADDPAVDIQLGYPRAKPDDRDLSGDVDIRAASRDSGKSYALEIRDNAYKGGDQKQILAPGGAASLMVKTQRSFGWYDFSIRIAEHARFERRYAGRVETGRWSFSDPMMGRVVG